MLITLYTFQGKTKGYIFFSDLNFSFRDVVADEWDLFSLKKESNIMTSMLLSCLRTGINLGRFCSGFRGLGPNTSSIYLEAENNFGISRGRGRAAW